VIWHKIFKNFINLHFLLKYLLYTLTNFSPIFFLSHNPAFNFSKNKRGKVATIVPKVSGVSIGQREMLSKLDCMKERQSLNVVFILAENCINVQLTF
jgi:hypothetical protein